MRLSNTMTLALRMQDNDAKVLERAAAIKAEQDLYLSDPVYRAWRNMRDDKARHEASLNRIRLTGDDQ